MKGLWDHIRAIVQLLPSDYPIADTPRSQNSSSLTIEVDLPHRAWVCSALPHSLPSAGKGHISFSQCVGAVGNTFRPHRKSCRCPPRSCTAIFCSSKRPAPHGWQWHTASVQMAEPLPWQAARYLGAWFANLTFYFVSSRAKCRALLLQSFLLFSFLGTQFSWNYFRVNGHSSRALTRCRQECFCSFPLARDSGEASWDSPWYHNYAKNDSLESVRALLFSQVFTPSTNFLLTNLIMG